MTSWRESYGKRVEGKRQRDAGSGLGRERIGNSWWKATDNDINCSDTDVRNTGADDKRSKRRNFEERRNKETGRAREEGRYGIEKNR